MNAISPTQHAYLQAIAAQPGPVAAADAFYKLRMSKLSIGRMLENGWIEKVLIDGKSHYRPTAKGGAMLPASHPGHNCPKCNSPSPERHPAVQHEGEVEICADDYHLIPTNQNAPAHIARVLAKRAAS